MIKEEVGSTIIGEKIVGNKKVRKERSDKKIRVNTPLNKETVKLLEDYAFAIQPNAARSLRVLRDGWQPKMSHQGISGSRDLLATNA